MCNAPTISPLFCFQGNSPGGGCMIALSCDYRIMAPGYKIGYNEVKGVSMFLIVFSFQTEDNYINL